MLGDSKRSSIHPPKVVSGQYLAPIAYFRFASSLAINAQLQRKTACRPDCLQSRAHGLAFGVTFVTVSSLNMPPLMSPSRIQTSACHHSLYARLAASIRRESGRNITGQARSSTVRHFPRDSTRSPASYPTQVPPSCAIWKPDPRHCAVPAGAGAPQYSGRSCR